MRFVGWFCYHAAQLITYLLAKFMWNMKVDGVHHLPKSGAFLLCPVHRSNVDGPITCTFRYKRMRYLAKESMFKIRGLADVYRAMGAIKVNRGVPDRKSLHACLEALESGYPLVLFPEGTRKSGDIIEEINEGAVYLAMRAGVPIVPVGIGGSEAAHPKGSKFLHRANIRVKIGSPMMFDTGESKRASRNAIREGTDLLRDRLQQLYDESRESAQS